MSNNLLSKKSSLTSRHNIIIYIITTILILGIVAGFTNTFNTDNSRHKASFGETIVMESTPPATGSPSDYTALETLKFTAYRLHHSTYFRGYTEGKVSADISIGSYTQYLTNTRVVYNENTVFTETISSSSLKSLAEQKYADNGVIIYRAAEKISGGSATFKSTAAQMSYDDYSEKYGSVPNQLSKYIINEDTILSIKDENAQTQSPLNSDGSGDIQFEVPQKLVQGADGNYVFTLTLDPMASSLYYRNEVRTLGGADQNPKFYSVQITITVNSDWYPVSTRTIENYDIAIPVLGAMNCSGDNYEVFSMFNEDGDIPEQDFFQPYVDRAKADPDYVPPVIDISGPPSASDYLASAFAPYLSGSSNLDLSANIKINGIPVLDTFTANNLTLSVNLKTLDIQAMSGRGLYVKYSGGNIYIKNNDVNGYISAEAIKKLTEDPLLKDLLGGIGDLDTTKIFGGDMLDVIFKDCEMKIENGIADIPMSFSLDLSSVIPSLTDVHIEASIKINDGDKSLNSITGTVTIGDVKVKIDVKPLNKLPAFPSTDDAVDLSGLLDFVPDTVNTVNQKTYAIDGTISLNGTEVGVNAYIDRTNGVAAEAEIDLSGLKIKIKYADDVIYADALGVVVRGTKDELPQLLDALLELTGSDKLSGMLKAILPKSLNQLTDMLKTLTVTEDSADIGLEYMTVPVNITLTRGDGKLTGAALGINVDLFGIKADLSADLKISEPAPHAVTVPETDSYLTFADLASLIADIKPYLQGGVNYTVALNGSIQAGDKAISLGGDINIDRVPDKDGNVNTAVNGQITALGQKVGLTYINNVMYVDIGEIKAKLDVANMGDLIASAKKLLNTFIDVDPMPEIDVAGLLDGAVKSVAMKNGKLIIELSVDGVNVSAAVDLKAGTISAAACLGEVKISIDLALTMTEKSHNITAPTGTYIDVNKLTATLDGATKLISAKAATATIALDIAGKSIALDLAVDLSDGLKARITEKTFGLEVVIIGDTAYINIGNIRLCGSVADALALYDTVRENCDALPALDELVNILPKDVDIQGLLATAIGAVKSLELKGGVISADIAVDGFGLSVDVNSDLSAVKVATAIGQTQISATIDISAGCQPISVPSGKYSSISELQKLLPAVLSLVDSKAFSVSYDVEVSGIDGTDFAVSADGTVDIDISNGIAAAATVNTFGQTLDIAYGDGTVYLSLGALKFRLNTADINTLLPSVTKLLTALGININIPDNIDISGMASDLLGTLDIKQTVTKVIDSVTLLEINDGVITVNVKYGDHSAALTVAPAGDGISLVISGTLFAMGINASADIAPSNNTVELPNAVQYSDISELTATLDGATKLISAKSATATIALDIAGTSIALDLAVDLSDGLKARITEKTLGLEVVVIGDTAYISLNDIKISGKIADITAIMNVVMPNLPEPLSAMLGGVGGLDGMLSNKPDLTTDGKLDINKTMAFVRSALTTLVIANGNINIAVGLDALSANLDFATDLSEVAGNINITLPNGADKKEAVTVGIAVADITAETVIINGVNAQEYVPASVLIDVLGSVMPLAKEKAFTIEISATAFGQTVNGSAYVNVGEYTLDSLSAEVKLDIAGMPVKLALINKTLYLDINNGSLRIAQPLTADGINSIIAQIDEALPDLDLGEKLAGLTSGITQDIDVADLLTKIALSPVENGMKVHVDINDNTQIDISIGLNGDKLCSIGATCSIDGKIVDIALNVTTDDAGVITAVNTEKADIMGTEIGLSLEIAPDAQRDVTVDGDHVTIDDIIPLISPVMSLMEKATSASSISVSLSDMVIKVMGKQMVVGGTVDICFDPIAVRAVLTLFADSNTDKLDLTVVYVNNVLYIDIGEIALKFDITNDLSKINTAIQPYLPKSLKNLGDLGAMSPILAIVNNVTAAAKATDISTALATLFNKVTAYGESTVKLAADMLGIFKRGSDGKLAIGINVMDQPMAVTLNIIPVINDGNIDFKLSLAASDMLSVNFTAMLDFNNGNFAVEAPTDTVYTPIVDFVTTVISAVNTLSAETEKEIKDETTGEVIGKQSQRAFEIDTFAFDYDIFRIKTEKDETTGEVIEVKDEAGRPVIETDADGNKIKDKVIKINNIEGQDALKFCLTTTTEKDKDGKDVKSTKLAVEAHIKLDIQERDKSDNLVTKNGFPITLDLYVQPLDTKEQGLVYLYYREANGYGEKISIDYTSVLQMVAAVADIMNVKGETVESLLGKYRLDIDKTVFKSMSIEGLDSVSSMLNNLIGAVDEAKLALNDAKAALSRIQNAEKLDDLIYDILHDATEDGQMTAKAYLDGAIDHIGSAIALFSSNDDRQNSETTTPDGTGEGSDKTDDNKINGALVGKVVNSVYFRSENSELNAYVNNAVATDTDGWAVVSVACANDKINSIGVDNLDVNKAKLNTFDMRFTPITDILTVTVPEDSNTEDNADGKHKVMHADLSKLKHLIFDVMNTANMLEFEIGNDANDGISIVMDLSVIAKLYLNVGYNAKVKIIDTGEVDSDGNAIYKTAAAIEILNHKSEAELLSGIKRDVVIPECSTMLYFYDDVIYIQGVRNWGDNNITIGKTHTTNSATTQTRERTGFLNLGWTDWSQPSDPVITTETSSLTTKSSDTYSFDYVNVMYTVDELFYMMKNDISKFLDEFLYYLIPIKQGKILGVVDIRTTIADQIGKPADETKVNTQNTLAQIFKSYKYNGSEHSIVIGLAELAGSTSLSDVTLTLVGKNDGDDNENKIKNNYISYLSVGTKIANIIDISLKATLNNVHENTDDTINSMGLTHVTSNYYYNNFSFNNNNYVMINSYLPDTVLTIDGKSLYSTMTDGALFASLDKVIPIINADSYDSQNALHRSENTSQSTSGGGGLDNWKTTTVTTQKHWLTTGYYKTGEKTNYYIGVDADGSRYIYKLDENNDRIRIAVKSTIDTILAEVTRNENGKITDVANRAGGVQWDRPWKAAYDAAQAAENAAA